MYGYAEVYSPSLFGSGSHPLLSKCDPFCALQAYLKVRLFRLFFWSRRRFFVFSLHGTGAGAAWFVGLLDTLGHGVVVLDSGQLTYLG